MYRRIRPATVGAAAAPAGAPSGYTPLDVAKLYDFPQETGKGQCIAIIELGGGFQQADLQQYFSQLGVNMPSVTAVSVGSGVNSPTGDPNGPDGEVMLDIEVAGGVAPDASVVVYFAPNTNQGFAEAIMAAVHDTTHRPSVISISWGGPETRWPVTGRRMMNQAIQAGLAMGITTFVASGDNGSSDGLPGRSGRVDFPASSPYAVGCGGTRLVSQGGSIVSEVVWNDPGDGATGGGVSAFFPVPSYQQSVHPISANPAHRPGRGVPDVAGNASPVSGYEIRVDGQTGIIGGTSAVAPLWAGLLALVQEGLGKSAAPLQPSIYANPGAFRDITAGNNGIYRAAPGWDPCTGLGSPNGAALLKALSGSSGSSSGGSSGHEARAAESASKSSRQRSG
jgi:kumamolisin